VRPESIADGLSENIHLQPYSSEDDFYARIYPKYLALLDKAKLYMDETEADPDRTIVLIR
jgi:histone deacetylase HOS3